MEENAMTYDLQTEAILGAGMKLLREHLGIIETEIFIGVINRRGRDYTAERENLYEDMTLEELMEHASDVTKEFFRHNPDFNKGKTIL
jgi:hypothetical protein